jgi:hypothetical protein
MRTSIEATRSSWKESRCCTGNYSKAIAALKSIRNPKPDVTAELAYTYQLDSKLDNSAKLYWDATRMRKSTFSAWNRADPSLYVPYLALGDLCTARREFTKAEDCYSKGYSLGPRKALILAGGMNAPIQAHNLSLAWTWLSRVTQPDGRKHSRALLL